MATKTTKKAASPKPAPRTPVTVAEVLYLQLYYTLEPATPGPGLLAAAVKKIHRRRYPDPCNGTIPHHPPGTNFRGARAVAMDPYASVPTRWTAIETLSNDALPFDYEVAIRRVPKKK